MVKRITFLFLMMISGLKSFAQAGPGLLISEILANPAGTDSPFEFVELLATRSINFSMSNTICATARLAQTDKQT